MGKKMSDDVIDEVVSLYLAGWKMKDIAAKVGFSKDAVRRALKKRGVWKRGKVTKEVEEKIVDLYVNEGLSAYKVGEFVGVSAKTVYDVLKKYGIETRNNGVPDEVRGEIIRLYESGLSMDAIAEKFGIGHETVRSVLAKAGIKSRKRVLSDVEKAEIVRLYVEEGWSLEKIAKKFGITSGGVLYHLKSMGIDRRPQRLSKEMEEKIVELRRQGKSIRDIVLDLDVSTSVVRRVLGDYGVEDIAVSENRSDKIPIEVRKAIVEDYENGLSLKEIMKKYDVSISTIYRYVNNGVEDRPWLNRIYHFNEDYFEEIDSCDKAYFLGLLASDGWVDDEINYAISITLKYEDGYILREFVKHLGLDWYDVMKLRFNRASGFRKNAGYYWRLTIYSKKMIEDLMKYGLHTRKSYDLKPPENIPEEFLGDFWRGMLDGDGSVRIVKNNKGYSYLRVELAGTEAIVRGFGDFLDIGGHVRKIDGGVWVFMGSIGQVEDKFEKVFTKLYGSDCDLFLQRKFGRFVEFGINYVFGYCGLI